MNSSTWERRKKRYEFTWGGVKPFAKKKWVKYYSLVEIQNQGFIRKLQ
jgi:hypothetical protein